MTQHTPLEWLSAYLDGQVSSEERRQVEAHLQTCAACRRSLADLQRTVALVQGLEPVGAPAGFGAAIRTRLQQDRSVIGRLGRIWPSSWTGAVRSPSPGRGMRGPSWRAALAVAAIVLIGLFSVNLWQEIAPARREPLNTNLGQADSLRGQPEAVEALKITKEERATRNQPVSAEAPSAGVQGVSRLAFDRQVIRTATLRVEVVKFQQGERALVRIAEQAGGFVADSTISHETSPSGTFTLRVPALRFSEVLDRIEALGKVTGRRVSGQDITEEFIDLRARVRNLEHHERQLLTFMEKATKVADLLAIEQELSRVRGEIEQLTGRLRFLGNRVEMATLEVALYEKAKPSGALFWDFTASLHKVRAAFLGTIRQLLAASERLLIVISALAPLALLALAGWALIRWLSRRGASAV
jgi:hypothetical protein